MDEAPSFYKKFFRFLIKIMQNWRKRKMRAPALKTVCRKHIFVCRRHMISFSETNRTGYFSLALLIFALLLPGCAKKKESLPVSDGGAVTAYQEFGATTLFFYEGRHKRWRLDADYMKKPLADTGNMLVIPVRLVLYDSLGNTRTRVLADSGSTTPSLRSFTVWGNVYIRNQDSLIVKTQKLWWIKDSRKVESDTYVQIETVKGDVLRGKGLNATEDFSRFSFKSEVSGKFPDFKRRVESNDDHLY
jgi:LPS export ABC transporter protein LptC